MILHVVSSCRAVKISISCMYFNFSLCIIFSTFGGLVLSPLGKSQRLFGNILTELERKQEVPGYFILHRFRDFVQYIFSTTFVSVSDVLFATFLYLPDVEPQRL